MFQSRMTKRSGWNGVLLASALAFVVLLAGPAVSRAQEPTPETETSEAERVEELERQVEELRSQVEALRAEAEEAAAAAEAMAAETEAEEAGETEPPAASPDRLAEVERRLEVLASEIERLQLGEAAAEADQPQYGFGPAASKIYRTGQGLSIGGYGEMLYQGFDSRRDDGTPSGERDELDFLRAIVYFGYKFNDRFLFNSEIEYEHASSGAEGEVSVEFAYLDYLWKPELNARAGLLLLPMGFVNELHEPTVFLGARRPDVERVILPTTWRENGFGLFGDLGPFTYRTYVVNGFDASGFSAGGLRGGRQKGSHALAEDFAWVGRLDYTGTPGLLVGVSAYAGSSGQGLTDGAGRTVDVGTTILEGHAEWRWRGLEARALFARAELDDVARLNQALGLTGGRSVGEALEGYYFQLGYDVLNRVQAGRKALIPYARYESFDTQAKVPAGFSRDPARDVESLTLGVAFRPIDQIVIKADYQDYDNGAGTGVDQLNVAIGYVF